jgi:hypothetical protein
MNRTDGIEWVLIPAAVLLLALLHRAELIAIIVPLALLVAYFACGSSQSRESHQRKI